uniref:OTU domain-containing protein n=1 Tax=viral metagenome TaxID=1070528 RepID=A0A6C0ATF6_9ZZZZ
MVKSIINPDEVDYKETKDIDKADIGYTTTLYEYTIYGKQSEIGLGKENYSFMRHNIVYYPIYLILDDEPKARVGVFEVNSNKLIDIVDEDGDLDLSKGNIILFITEAYFNKILEENQEDAEEEDDDKNKDDTTTREPKLDEDEEEDDDTAVMRIKIPSNKLSLASATATETLKSKTKDTEIFTANSKTKIPEQLLEETQEIADELKRDFKDEVHDVWMQKFMKNKNYDIIDNEGGGDCFFAVIRDAFKQIGKDTTVEKLRAALSKEATEELFTQNRTLYLSFLGELNDKEKVLKDLKKTMQVIKKRNKAAKTKPEQDTLLDEAKELLKLYKGATEEKAITKELMGEFDYMENIDSLEKFKEFMQTRDYWADTWAVSTMERILNIKMIILSEESYDAKDYDSVLRCGQLNDADLERQGVFVPDFYIMTSYSGDHYKLVTYKEKHIFKYKEVPYDIKMLVLNKCLERNAGPYYIIKDFRDLKTKLGMDPNEGEPNAEEDDELYRDLYEPNIVFMYHAHSNATPKAGDGSGEKIPKTRMHEFNVLNKIKEWRKMLDDSWTSPFTIDHHRFNTVEHYKLGSQFKKGFPDFYLQFSSDSNSDISKDLALAKIAGSKSGKTKEKVLRERKIKIDSDYDDNSANPRKNEERRIALHAKFTQNQDLAQALKETKTAKLVHFTRGKEGECDLLLMKVRKDLA